MPGPMALYYFKKASASRAATMVLIRLTPLLLSQPRRCHVAPSRLSQKVPMIAAPAANAVQPYGIKRQQEATSATRSAATMPLTVPARVMPPAMHFAEPRGKYPRCPLR